MPRVGVVIPAYNPGHFIDSAVRSVIDQTFRDWELVIINDGGNEDLSRLASLDTRIKVINQHNAGQATARNRGVAATSGEFIAFLDQDDLWHSEKLAEQVAMLDRDGSPACHTQFDFIDFSGRFQGSGYGCKQNYLQMLEGSSICGSSAVLLRRGAFEQANGFDAAMEPVEDYDLWLRLQWNGTIHFLPRVLTYYRIHAGNQSKQYHRNYHGIKRVLRRAKNLSPKDASVARAATVGQRNHRKNVGGMAFAAARDAKPLSLRQMRHVIWSLVYAPNLTVCSILRYGFRKILAGTARRGDA